MSSPRRNPRPLRVCLRAGLIAGVVASVLASVVSLALQSVTGEHFSQLGVAPVALAALLTNLAGGAVYWFLLEHTARPTAWFAGLAGALATLDTQLTIVTHHDAMFATLAAPLHFSVAALAATVIPAIVEGRLTLMPLNWKRRTTC
jgi:hypothetical protein